MPPSAKVNPIESLPLSLLNDFLYCPRRAALKIVEGWREGNVHTERGDIVHEHADLPGYEVVKGVMLWRALPVFSERLGLNGKCDIVEAEFEVAQASSPAGSPGVPPGGGKMPPALAGRRPALRSLRPVEFKVGKRRQWVNDDAQLCAQALCLEEMFNLSIPRGAVFHADSKRRREVEFTPQLRQLTENAVMEVHALLENSKVPLAAFKPACRECSLYAICLPQVTSQPARLAKATAALFES